MVVTVSDRDMGLSRPVTLRLGDGNDVYFNLDETVPPDATGTANYTLTRTDTKFDYESERTYQVEFDLMVSVDCRCRFNYHCTMTYHESNELLYMMIKLVVL